MLGASLSHADEEQVFAATRPHMPRLSTCIQLKELEKDSVPPFAASVPASVATSLNKQQHQQLHHQTKHATFQGANAVRV